MFIVNVENGGVVTEIHGEKQKLKSGKVIKGINSIDSFSFTMLPSNAGFERINDFVTIVKVYNTNKLRYEFFGRVLYSDTTMSESGLITKDVTCESFFGFLCDSQQVYIAEQNWTVNGLLQHLIDVHNSQTEEYKHFTLGEVTVTDPNNNLYCGIQRENTWDAIKKKLLDVLGGEIRFRYVGGVLYLDYLTRIGETRGTAIAVSHNMKSIKQEKDPSAYITRLIPLGCKLKDANGKDTEARLDISSVNDGKIYIDDEQAIAAYGINVGYKEWDDVTIASNLKTKGEKWLADNNKVQIKYSITALDLSLLGLDVDDFEACDSYPIKNALIGVDDVARLIKKSIDVCEEIKSTIEFGENFKTLSDIQLEQSAATSVKITAVAEQATKTDSNMQAIDNRLKEVEENGTGGSNITFATEAPTAEDGENGEMRVVRIGSGLPDGYTRLKYIESDGTQRANTGVKADKNTRIIADIETASAVSKNSWLLGSRNSDNSNRFDLIYAPGDSTLRFYYNSTKYVFPGVSLGRLAIDLASDSATVNGVTVTPDAAPITSENNILIFTCSGGVLADEAISQKVYSFKIYNGADLIRDFIPCINNNNEVGLYDVVNGAFYGDAAGGAFIAGDAADEYPACAAYFKYENVWYKVRN